MREPLFFWCGWASCKSQAAEQSPVLVTSYFICLLCNATSGKGWLVQCLAAPFRGQRSWKGTKLPLQRTFWNLGLISLEELKKIVLLFVVCVVKSLSQMSSSWSTLTKSSYCTFCLFLHAFCNKIVKSTDILQYYFHEVTVLQWMGLFTPQTMVPFLISLHTKEISYVGYTWITLEVFHLNTQELKPFSL